jgi:uncharacterized protein YecT (DUF1311 family)
MIVRAIFTVSFASLIALSPARAEGVSSISATVCDTKKFGGKDLADCLRAASEKSERDMTALLDAASKNIEGRAGLQSGQKARWKRALNDAHALWLRYRDAECQDVSPFEAGINKVGGDTRLSCIIDLNDRRISELRARYP